jgi:2-polyprenyl-6-methoxyphenol hydroxylase-like FAD-dependent oxidoreductase
VSSPSATAGTNFAMFDGSELGRAIAAHPDDVEAALGEYEQVLFPRSAQFAAESGRNHKLLLGDNTPDGLLKLLTGQELGE